jgi:cell division protein FtsB
MIAAIAVGVIVSLLDNVHIMIRIILLSVIVLLIFLFVFLIRRNTRIARQEVMINEQREEIERQKGEIENQKADLKRKREQIESLKTETEELQSCDDRDQLYNALGVEVSKRDGDVRSSDKARNLLYFMGVCGNKWVNSKNRQKKLRNMLKKVKNNGGEVRFLLIHPSERAYFDLYHAYGLPSESYEKFEKLEEEFKGVFKVKLYNHVPLMRMIFVNKGGFVEMSAYSFGEEEEEWREADCSLIIKFERDASDIDDSKTEHKDSIASGLLGVYDLIWNSAKPLQDWIDNGKIIQRSEEFIQVEKGES